MEKQKSSFNFDLDEDEDDERLKQLMNKLKKRDDIL